MENSFKDEGLLAKSIPWISIPLVIILAAAVISSDRSVVLKLLAPVAAIIVTVSCARKIARQFNSQR